MWLGDVFLHINSTNSQILAGEISPAALLKSLSSTKKLL